MEAVDFLDIIEPEHDRGSCSDADTNNGFFSRNGKTWHGRCRRCMCLQLIAGEKPKGFVPDECEG